MSEARYFAVPQSSDMNTCRRLPVCVFVSHTAVNANKLFNEMCVVQYIHCSPHTLRYELLKLQFLCFFFVLPSIRSALPLHASISCYRRCVRCVCNRCIDVRTIIHIPMHSESRIKYLIHSIDRIIRIVAIHLLRKNGSKVHSRTLMSS